MRERTQGLARGERPAVRGGEAAEISAPGTTTESRYGSGARARPSSVSTVATSTGPAPAPPSSSENDNPRMPISASEFHTSRFQPSSLSVTLRTVSTS